MMFLQYFIQGSYLPVASLYVQNALGFTADQVGLFSSALAVGPILAPYLLGQLVDRMFSTEHVMAVCHFVAGLLMLLLFAAKDVGLVMVLGTVYSVLYVPTMMLSNSVAFKHLRNSDFEFPWVRAFGTLGFIAPAFIIESVWLAGLEGDELEQARGIVFGLAGMMGLVMGIYCLTLPSTPPQRSVDRRYAPGVVIGMMRYRYFSVLVVISFLLAIAHQFFFVWNGPFLQAILKSGNVTGAYELRISSIGQIFELVVMAFLGFGIKRLGFKSTLVIGASAYTLRCLLFSSVFSLDPAFPAKLVIAGVGQALHGVCFGCFFAAAYMYVDRVSPPDVRGSMQTLYGTFVVALGFLAGGFVGGRVGQYFSVEAGSETIRDWSMIWLSCAILAAACIAGLIAFFPARMPEVTE
jgi:nucleoside transporter